MSITKEVKKDLISKFAINDKDTGSAEVQIAVQTERINNLIEHFKNHKHDNHSKRGLVALVNNRKKLYEHYAGMFPSRELFDQVFLQVTDDYGVMVINNRLRSSDIRKKVFWYKAKKRGELSVGCSRFRSFHKLYYDPNHDKRLPFIDMNNFGSKKKTNVHVVKRVEDDDDI